MNEYFENHLTRLATTKQEFAELDQIDLTQYPTSIFKYKPCNQYTFDMLSEQYLYASLPSKLDDDTDSIIRITMNELQKEKLEEFFIKHLGEIVFYNIKPVGLHIKKKQHLSLSKCKSVQKQLWKEYILTKNKNGFFPITEESKKILSMLDCDHFYDKLEQWVDNCCKYLRDKIYVCCVSHRNNNRKNWEYYADKNRGIVIEYSIEENYKELNNHIGNLFPINYYEQDAFPLIDFADLIIRSESIKLGYQINMDDLKIELLRCTLNKCSDYREEEEWRILSLSNKIPFTIKAVYIGRLCCETDKAKILQICNQSKIPVFQQRTSVINGVMHFDQLP